MATDFSSQIQAIYAAVQYRGGAGQPQAPVASVAVYNAALQSGGQTLAQVQSSIINEAFTKTIVNPVILEYQAAFGRVPDATGAAYWVSVVAANPTAGLAGLATTFANSPEFTARFGASAKSVASPALVTALYTNVYGRPPDAAGLQFWANSGLTAAALLNAFANGTEFQASTAGALLTFHQAAITGNPYTTGSLFALSNVPPPGSTLALTTILDVLTGNAGNDTFNALLAGVGVTGGTLTAGDSINGLGGTDTLKLVVDAGTAGGASLPANISLTGIAKFDLVTSNTAGITIDAAKIAGLSAATIQHGGTGLLLLDNLGKTVPITFSGTEAGTIKLGFKGVAATDTINLVLNAQTGATPTSSLALTLQKGSTAAAADVAPNAVAITGTSGNVTITDTELSSLKLTTTGSTTIALATGTNLTTFDASGSTGSVTADFLGTSGLTSYVGGSGSNIVSITGGRYAFDLSRSAAVADFLDLSGYSANGTNGTTAPAITGFINDANAGDSLGLIGTVTIASTGVFNYVNGGITITATVAPNGAVSFTGLAGTPTLDDFAKAAGNAMGATSGRAAIFQVAGDSYVLEDTNNTAGFTAGTDLLIKLVGISGVTSLSTTASAADTVFVM